MQIQLKYGRGSLDVEVPDDATVVWPQETAGLADEGAALTQALRQPLGTPPLRELAGAGDRVAVVFSDITRPMPSDRVLPALLAELAHVPREQITLINATGTHRANTPEELDGMLGPEIACGYPIHQHDAWDQADLVHLGTTRFGHPVWVNRHFYEADVRILTGFIEPHIFAGFSGGPKAVLPGVSGFETIVANHGTQMLAHDTAVWGHTEDNPVWLEIAEAAEMARPSFLLNVTLNRHRQLTGVFAGEWRQAHRQGTDFMRRVAMAPVKEQFDIVITTNSGYPLDINLYQSVKGMSSAAQIVKPGGAIVIAAECRDGIPDYGEYRRLIHEGGSVEGIMALISQPGFRCHDQWEAQLQAGIMRKAEVHVYSDYLTDEQLTGMLFTPCRSLAATLAALQERYGPGARICVLPEGPQTIPYVEA